MVQRMAKPVRLGLVLEGKAAEEFWKNEEATAFTPRQLAMFKEAKQIYRTNRSRF
jgi:hypothetical protein